MKNFNLIASAIILVALIFLSGCKTTDVSDTNLPIGKSPENIYAEIKLSSEQFAGMTADGELAIEGPTKMGMDVSALLGIKVLSAYFNGNSAKIAIHYNSTKVEEEQFYDKINEILKATLTPELLISLFKGTIPSNVKFEIEPEEKDNGNTLYTHILSTGVEYFLLDKDNRLIQYQQKAREESRTISFVYSDYKIIDGIYQFPHVIQIKVPELDFNGQINYENVNTSIPDDYKFDFKIPSNYKAG